MLWVNSSPVKFQALIMGSHTKIKVLRIATARSYPSCRGSPGEPATFNKLDSSAVTLVCASLLDSPL